MDASALVPYLVAKEVRHHGNPWRPTRNRFNFSEFARRIGISNRTLLRIAHGQTKSITFDTADKIATGLGYHVENIWPSELA